MPAFGALVAEPLFLLSDTAIVGHLGTAQLGGLGVAGQALTTIVYVCVFLAYGTTAGVARQVGAGDMRAAIRQGIDGLWLALAIGAVLVVAGWPLVSWIVDAFGASPASRRTPRRTSRSACWASRGCCSCSPGRAYSAASRTRAPRSPCRSAASH